MTTTTPTAVYAHRAESARQRYNRIAGWLTKVDNHIANGTPLTGRPASESTKGWMYDDLYVTAKHLGIDRAHGLVGCHRILTAAKDAGLITGMIRPVPTSVIRHNAEWSKAFNAPCFDI